MHKASSQAWGQGYPGIWVLTSQEDPAQKVVIRLFFLVLTGVPPHNGKPSS